MAKEYALRPCPVRPGLVKDLREQLEALATSGTHVTGTLAQESLSGTAAYVLADILRWVEAMDALIRVEGVRLQAGSEAQQLELLQKIRAELQQQSARGRT